jgi:hypothetical protein
MEQDFTEQEKKTLACASVGINGAIEMAKQIVREKHQKIVQNPLNRCANGKCSPLNYPLNKKLTPQQFINLSIAQKQIEKKFNQ